MGTGFTKVVNWRYVYICQNSIVSAGFMKKFSAVKVALSYSWSVTEVYFITI